MIDSTKKSIAGFAKLTLGLLNIFLFGAIFPLLWFWFLTPLTGLTITFCGALGLELMMHLILPTSAHIALERELARMYPDLEEYEVAVAQRAARTIVILASWGIGALIHAFM